VVLLQLTYSACGYPCRNGKFLVYSSSTSLGLDYIDLGVNGSVAACCGLWLISTVHANNILFKKHSTSLYPYVAGSWHLLVLSDNCWLVTLFPRQYSFCVIYVHFIYAQLQASSLCHSQLSCWTIWWVAVLYTHDSYSWCCFIMVFWHVYIRLAAVVSTFSFDCTIFICIEANLVLLQMMTNKEWLSV
jgi:hypothetical protein